MCTGAGREKATHLANANIIRLLVVMTLRVAKARQTRGSLYIYQPDSSTRKVSYISRQIAPAVFFVACRKICNSGPALELMTSSMSPATKSSTMRNTAPVKVPIPTQETMILGPRTEGWGTSVWFRVGI